MGGRSPHLPFLCLGGGLGACPHYFKAGTFLRFRRVRVEPVFVCLCCSLFVVETDTDEAPGVPYFVGEALAGVKCLFFVKNALGITVDY